MENTFTPSDLIKRAKGNLSELGASVQSAVIGMTPEQVAAKYNDPQLKRNTEVTTGKTQTDITPEQADIIAGHTRQNSVLGKAEVFGASMASQAAEAAQRLQSSEMGGKVINQAVEFGAKADALLQRMEASDTAALVQKKAGELSSSFKRMFGGSKSEPSKTSAPKL